MKVGRTKIPSSMVVRGGGGIDPYRRCVECIRLHAFVTRGGGADPRFDCHGTGWSKGIIDFIPSSVFVLLLRFSFVTQKKLVSDAQRTL